MSDLDKINIYVPRYIKEILLRDALLFEIFKQDMRTVNTNRFLSLLLVGYYDSYKDEYRNAIQKAAERIEQYAHLSANGESARLAEIILRDILTPQVPSHKNKTEERLSLKPTAATENYIYTIEENLGDDTLSGFFSRMLYSYTLKPQYERERIIFSDNYKFLIEACKSRSPISFSTTQDKKNINYAVPYELVVSHEETMNYLLCQNRKTTLGEQSPGVFRLNRINCPKYSGRTDTLSEPVTARLDKMKKYGPPYVIDSDDEICVKLTEEGERNYNRIYFARPAYDRIEHKDDGHYYYFNCSENQVFLYFRRFDGDSAEILYPSRLRKKMIEFHKNALKPYT